MKRTDLFRAAFTVAALAAAPIAVADGGGAITTTGWMSLLGVGGVAGILYWVHKKIG